MIRFAGRSDLSSIGTLIGALAAYEGVAGAARFDAAVVEEHLFGNRPYIEALLAVEEDAAVGLALFCPKYGRSLMSHLAHVAVDRGWARMEWSVLDWNDGAAAFYRSLGAAAMDDRTTFRLANDAMVALAGR